MEAMCKLVVVQHRLPPMTKYQDLLGSLILKQILELLKKKYDKPKVEK